VSLARYREIPGTTEEAAAQEVSTFAPSLVVPQGESETEERLRMLRLVDAALTPADMSGAFGLPAWALDTARLARAMYHAESSGILAKPATPDSGLYEKYVVNLPIISAVQRAAAIGRAAMICGFPTRYDDESPIVTWEDVIAEAAKLMQRSLANGEPPPPPPPPPPPKKPQGGETKVKSRSEGEGGEGEGKKYRTPEEIQADPKPKPLTPTKLGSDQEFTDDELESNPWELGTTPPPSRGGLNTGHCENFNKPDMLPMEPRRRKQGARKRSNVSGTVLGRISRLWTDQKIFRAGIIRRGGYRGRGTVMVDLSGSMCWTRKSYAALIEALPECTVYGYAGRDGRGRLVLLADRGRMARLDAVEAWKNRVGCGNEIDDSALRFLARQTAPRIWISDGGVCAYNCDTYHMIAECNKALASGRIIRVEDAQQANLAIFGPSVSPSKLD